MSTTFSTTVKNHTNIVTNEKHSTNAPVLQDRLQENGAFIGIVVGAGVVLIVIIVLGVFLLRRSKKTESKNLNSKSPRNSNNLSNGKPRVNAACNDIDEDFPYTKKHASIQLQNLDNESEPYTIPIKGEGSFGSTLENCIGTTTNEEESMIAVVQKGPRTGQELNNINHINEHLGSVHKRPIFYLEPLDSISDKVNFNNET